MNLFFEKKFWRARPKPDSLSLCRSDLARTGRGLPSSLLDRGLLRCLAMVFPPRLGSAYSSESSSRMSDSDQTSDAPTNGRNLRDRKFAVFQALSQLLDQLETFLLCQGLIFHRMKWLLPFGAVIEPPRNESIEFGFFDEPECMLPDLSESREVAHLLSQLFAIVFIIEKIYENPSETANSVVVGGFENAAIGFWNIIRNDWFLFGRAHRHKI